MTGLNAPVSRIYRGKLSEEHFDEGVAGRVGIVRGEQGRGIVFDI
jgi:hypothetical protein